MRNFYKFFLIVFWAAVILGSGYYLVFNNLSYILAGDKPGVVFAFNSSNIKIKTGRWVEDVKLDLPFKLTQNKGIYTLRSETGVLTVSIKPKFKIRWQP